MHPAALSIDDLLKECTLTRDRTRGPGGQHRNKNETGVFLTHDPTGIHAQATESRKQEENRKRAIKRLRTRLAIRHREWVPVPGFEPSELLRSRIQKGKLSVNPKHADFPAILAEVLDLLFEVRGDVSKASEYLDISSSQIIKFLKNEPEAFAALNEHRKEKRKRPLK